MLDQLLMMIGTGVALYWGFRLVFGVLGVGFRVLSPPLDRLDLWLKRKAPQPPAPRQLEPPLRGYSGYDIRTR